MYVYILTDPIYASHNRYKIGITSRQREQLTRDYLRYIPEVDIRLFLPCPQAHRVEKDVKRLLRDFVIVNRNGNASEWISYNLADLIRLVKKQIKAYRPLSVIELRGIYKKIGGTRNLRSHNTLTKGIMELAKSRPDFPLPPSLTASR